MPLIIPKPSKISHSTKHHKSNFHFSTLYKTNLRFINLSAVKNRILDFLQIAIHLFNSQIPLIITNPSKISHSTEHHKSSLHFPFPTKQSPFINSSATKNGILNHLHLTYKSKVFFFGLSKFLCL